MFIAIEGLDGAGKSTQVAKLQEYLSSKGLKWEYIHFPRYSAPYYGDMIARFLRGEFGDIDQVDPYIVALMYACDRMDAGRMISKWLGEGKVVIVDRYVLSNVAYQCAKANAGKEELKKWILGLEYEHNKIPRPDLTMFLDVPFKFTEKSLTKNRSEDDDRDYLQGEMDIHEASLDFQRKVREVYIQHRDEDYVILNCSTEDGEMASADEISKQIIALIQDKL